METTELIYLDVNDLTISKNGKTATYMLDGEEITVLSLILTTIHVLVEHQRFLGASDLEPWILKPAHDAGIRVRF